MNKHDIVMLSTADWDNPFWTNKQHVANELADLGNRVLYIDSLGLRRPSASARDIRRVGRRLVKAMQPPRKVRENLWVWSPVILPWHTNRWVRRANRRLLAVGLRVWLKVLGLTSDWLWTYNPLTTELMGLESFDKCIYHCVDEIKAQPGMPVKLLEQCEEKLTRSSDAVFTTSPRLTETRSVWNPKTRYLSNVADYRHFNKATSGDTQVPDDLARIPGPRIGFIGAISGYKIDFDLLGVLATSHPEWSVVLIGEVGEGDPWTNCESLKDVPNIHFLGPRPYAQLPAYLKGFAVAILPNMLNEYTDSMFPMKFFEYLAAGCPVVSVKLKALLEFEKVAFISESRESFIANIGSALKGEGALLPERLAVAQKYTYESRTRKMLDMIESGPTP